MAISYIKASPQWFRAAAKQAELVDPGTARELLRAIDRPMRMAHLTAEQTRVLAAVRPRDPRVTTALAELEAAEAGEARRLRGSALLQQIQAGRVGVVGHTPDFR